MKRNFLFMLLLTLLPLAGWAQSDRPQALNPSPTWAEGDEPVALIQGGTTPSTNYYYYLDDLEDGPNPPQYASQYTLNVVPTVSKIGEFRVYWYGMGINANNPTGALRDDFVQYFGQSRYIDVTVSERQPTITYENVKLTLSKYKDVYTGDDLTPTVTVQYFEDCDSDLPEAAYTATWHKDTKEGDVVTDGLKDVGKYVVVITANEGYQLNWASGQDGTAIFEIIPAFAWTSEPADRELFYSAGESQFLLDPNDLPKTNRDGATITFAPSETWTTTYTYEEIIADNDLKAEFSGTTIGEYSIFYYADYSGEARISGRYKVTIKEQNEPQTYTVQFKIDNGDFITEFAYAGGEVYPDVYYGDNSGYNAWCYSEDGETWSAPNEDDLFKVDKPGYYKAIIQTGSTIGDENNPYGILTVTDGREIKFSLDGGDSYTNSATYNGTSFYVGVYYGGPLQETQYAWRFSTTSDNFAGEYNTTDPLLVDAAGYYEVVVLNNAESPDADGNPRAVFTANPNGNVITFSYEGQTVDEVSFYGTSFEVTGLVNGQPSGSLDWFFSETGADGSWGEPITMGDNCEITQTGFYKAVFPDQAEYGDDDYATNTYAILPVTEATPEIVSYDWTSTPASVIYTGKAQKPEITVTGTTVAGEEVEIPEYSEGSAEAVNWVAKYYTDEECTNEVEKMIDPATYYVKVFVPGETEEFTEEIGTAKTYTIEKKTLYINLAYIYKNYGEPDPVHPTVDNFEFDPRTGAVPAGAKETICDYLVVKRATGYTGNTPGQYHYWYDYSESYKAGDAQYKIICLQNESNLIIDPGILTVTIDPESSTKVYGDPDPEYVFTATNTAGTEVTGVSVTRPEAGTEDGETVGNHPLTVTFDNPEEENYYTVVYDPADPQLEITVFDLEKDNDEEGGYGYGKDNYQPKFNIEVLPVTYNADTQFPDAKITFFSEALNKTIDLTYGEGTEPIVPFVKKWHEGGDTNEKGIYTTENYEYMKGASTYTYSDVARKGSYVPNVKAVKRNAETAAVEEGAAIIVEGKGAFINTKTQTYAIQPAKLSVKVKSFTGEWPGAGYNFGIELNTEGENGVWPEKEEATVRQQVLNAVGEAVAAYAPDGDYGYDYAGGTGNITVKVIEAAQTALNVVLAASNYDLDFAGGAADISNVTLAIVPDNQNGTYKVFDGETEVTDLSDLTQIYTYKRPELDQNAYKVMSGETEVTLPEGVKVTLTVDGTKVGDQNVISASVSNVPANFTITATATAKFTVAKLDEIHLAYNEVAQVLEDHQGQEDIRVFMPNRNLRNKRWYSMILPFNIDADEFFTDGLGYGAFETLNEDNTSSNPSFMLTIDGVEANTPFIVKVRNNFNKIGNTNAGEGEQLLASVSFENKTIATLPEGFAYNDITKAPYSEDKNGTKFVGQYTGKTGVAANERWMSKGEFYAGTETTTLDPTAAFLSFKSEQEAREAIIFIQELDGTYTPINAVKADDDNDAAADGIYDLSGRRVNKAQKGIYIQNGKKVLVK